MYHWGKAVVASQDSISCPENIVACSSLANTPGAGVADEWLPLTLLSMGGLRCARKQGKMRMDGQPFAVAALENHRGTPWAWERHAIRMEPD